MYKLIRSRFDGLTEIVEDLLISDDFEMLKSIQREKFNRGAYIDEFGNQWYTEVLSIEESKETKRLSMNMPTDLMERIDVYASRMSINRTSAINFLCTLSLDSQLAISNIDELIKIMKVAKEHDL